jgi:hypothetical protein
MAFGKADKRIPAILYPLILFLSADVPLEGFIPSIVTDAILYPIRRPIRLILSILSIRSKNSFNPF